MSNIKEQIDTGIPSNTEDNPWREEVTVDNTNEPQESSIEVENGPELEEENAPAAKTGKETPKYAKITKVPFPLRLEERQK
ncbi:hypothetical protein PVK06_012147 [Gossypium arboreum]|uniref:Uncharacterized protein n=1 Tax=Gossypium arboreum TaxID=29729 RepID=A0ABR0QBC1_GOSAR|nr:hypothetical protein PVK06_012147 [Gossypium arboreum]